MAAGWSVEEESKVLSFYALDDAFPDRWPDDEGLALATGAAVDREDVSNLADTPQEPPAEGQYMDGDALGIVRNLARIPIANESLKITSKNFDSSLFLRTVHANTSYADLERGMRHLESSINERTDTLRAMVKNDFDRFVNAKSSIDEICRQMRIGGEANWERALMELNRHLYGATSKAEEVFNPIIERRTRAEKLRLTVALLERWKFFFNLPTNLQQAIRKGKIDVAVRDYQKGHYLMKTTVGFKDQTARDTKGGPVLTEEQRKVFSSVWAEVEEIATNLRTMLVERLEDHTIPLDEQEKTLGFLLNLNAEDDPGWRFLESRFRYISSRLTQAYNEYLGAVDGELKPSKTHPGSAVPPDIDQYLAFMEAARTGKTSELAFFVENSLEFALWNHTFNLMSALVNVITTLMPDFSKLSRDYVEAKFSKPTVPTATTGRRRRPAVDMGRIKKCEEMEQHIGSLLSAILSRAFFLHLRTIDIRGAKRLQSASGVSDLAFATSNAALAAPEQALAFPPERAATVLNAHPVLFSHFFVNIMSEWDRCFDRIAPISGGGSGSWFIDQTVSRVHDVILRTIDLLCDNFVIEVRSLHGYEDWVILSPTQPSFTGASNIGTSPRTALLDLFDQFSRYFFATFRTLLSSTLLRRQPPQTVINDVPNSFAGLEHQLQDRVRHCLADSLYFFLDGLERLSLHRENARLDVTWGKAGASGSAKEGTVDGWSSSGAGKRHGVDSSRLDLRTLVVLSNLSFFVRRLVPDLVRHLENLVPGRLDEATLPIYKAAEALDFVLFENYVKRKSTKLSDIIRVGILFSGLDWFLLSRPQEIAAHVYDTIVSLVLIHAEVTAINGQLVDRIIGELLVDIAQTTLDSFRQIDRFSVAGMIQATLETHFVHKSLINFETDKSRKLMQLVYSTVARGTAHEDELLPASTERVMGLEALDRIASDAELQEMLVSVREYMVDIQQTTFNMTKSLTR